MAHVSFTPHLQRFFPDLGQTEVSAPTVAEAVAELDKRYPGLAAYITDEQGALRKHVNIFVGNLLVRDRKGLTDAITLNDELYVMQALSGG